MEKTRRQFSPQQKVAILREYLVEHVPVSDLCDKHKLHPTLFYQWQKAFFENGAAAFERRRPRSQSSSKEEDKIAALEAKLRNKTEVLASLSRNWCAQKKSLGRAKRTLGCARYP
jgi:transposase